MFKWITERFDGGSNKEVNVQWLHKLKTGGMTLTEAFDEFVATKLSLRHALARNGHTIADRLFKLYNVNDLPEELESSKKALNLTLNMTAPDCSIWIASQVMIT
jgi:hypothetical protein